mmetsp:Transcript_19671/g.45903  ORF Transcript_19671/g.45903 Transcript_19671/m.45903 type:complete len:215 (+) Transcript_19671:82-726(+)
MNERREENKTKRTRGGRAFRRRRNGMRTSGRAGIRPSYWSFSRRSARGGGRNPQKELGRVGRVCCAARRESSLQRWGGVRCVPGSSSSSLLLHRNRSRLPARTSCGIKGVCAFAFVVYRCAFPFVVYRGLCACVLTMKHVICVLEEKERESDGRRNRFPSSSSSSSTLFRVRRSLRTNRTPSSRKRSISSRATEGLSRRDEVRYSIARVRTTAR